MNIPGISSGAECRAAGRWATPGEGAAAAGSRPRFHGPFGSEYSAAARWSRLERLYIRLFGVVDLPSRMRARLVRRAMRNLSWNRMIDFGSGLGTYSFYFSRPPGVLVWGIDIQEHVISDCVEISRKLERKQARFICASTISGTGQFEPDSIDVVLSVEALQYLRDVQAGLHDIYRVLRPGGRLIGHVPVSGCRSGSDEGFRIDALISLVKNAGLEPVSVARVFGGPAMFLSLIFSRCVRSRILTAIVFPALLLASLACGGRSSRGCYCMFIARKR